MAKPLSDKQKLRNFFRDRSCGVRTAEPQCRHFGDCGGCEFQDIPYPEQLAMKQDAFAFITDCVTADLEAKAAAVGEAATAAKFAKEAALLRRQVKPLTPTIVRSPLPYSYRQRMDYVYAFDKAGLRKANRHRQVVELQECPLLGTDGFAVFQKALALAKTAGLESYDYLRHHGELRYFVVRRSRSGGILLSLVSKSKNAGPAIIALLEQLVAESDIVSGNWLLAEGLGDVSFGEVLHQSSKPYIVEEMNSIRLAIGPNTFFQSNPAVAEQAYAAIQAFTPDGGAVFDMYAGVGSIALSTAARAKKVIAAENAPDNVALAKINVAANAAANVELVEADAAAWLAEAAATARPDLIVVNPPRPGVDEKGMAAIAAMRPQRLAYLSCNPFTLLRNLAVVLDDYRIAALTLYDMFPQTRHFESLALLELCE